MSLIDFRHSLTLDLIERQALFTTIIKLGGAGAFVGSHGLSAD
jgi:hypothetical protein